ncbi:uncharacterized protein LOC124645475 [Helicoverpa zea]|uniref:uncharacterized protein LOC124645475 n=1 Tax=Helicoverpa zea TaxID=7113 RepID=UPI001F5AB253|nr:uncharacterized protein LOC124645475 [Helicoverpa zea]
MVTTRKMEKVMSHYDVSLLVDLIERNPIIRSKETNATTNRTKDDAWTSLAHEFNARSKSVTLIKEQLKLKWDDLKKRAGKRSPRIQLNNLKTAGGGGGKPGFNTSNELLDNVTGPLRPSRTRFVAPFVGEGSADRQLIVGDLGETGNGLEDNITPEETCHIAKDHQVTESPIKGEKLARDAVAD